MSDDEYEEVSGGEEEEELDELDDQVDNLSVADKDDEDKDDKEDSVEGEYELLNEPTKKQTHRKIIVIDPDKRKTSNYITKAEMTELTSIRATQISSRVNAMVDIGNLNDPIKIAQLEFNLRRCPLILRRTVKEVYDKNTNTLITYVEDFDVNEMKRPFTYDITDF
jgi:hypothetical protein